VKVLDQGVSVSQSKRQISGAQSVSYEQKDFIASNTDFKKLSRLEVCGATTLGILTLNRTTLRMYMLLTILVRTQHNDSQLY
jgi:hypothetical protein